MTLFRSMLLDSPLSLHCRRVQCCSEAQLLDRPLSLHCRQAKRCGEVRLAVWCRALTAAWLLAEAEAEEGSAAEPGLDLQQLDRRLV